MLRSFRPRFPDLVLLVLMGISLVGAVLAGQRNPQASLPARSLPLPSASLLQEGDILLRRGRGVLSESLRHLSLSDPAYSHAGILVKGPEGWLVLHALGGEDNPSDKLLAEPLARFARSDMNTALGVVRLGLDDSQRQRLIAVAKRIYEAGPSFDSDFDLASDERLYCTEFVYKAVSSATGDTNYLPLTRFSGRTFVACDNLYLNAHARIIYTYPNQRN